MNTEIINRNVTEVARENYATEQRDLIRQTVAPDASQAEFDLFLEISARYGLNPLHGEIYLAKMGGVNGGGGRFTVLVGRDGFLSIANRHPDFEGVDSDVVHEFDDFRRNGDGTIHHEYTLGSAGAMPTFEEPSPADDDAEPGQKKQIDPIIRKRGKILGAWALVHRKGRRPTYFFAPFVSYAKAKGPWASYPDAMIRKVAVANALREAFNLSGLYHEAEMDRIRAESGVTAEVEEGFGDDEIGQRLDKLVDQAHDVLPGEYRPARVRLVLAGASDEERKAFADTLEEKLAEASQEGAEEPATVIDAEVVEDDSETAEEPQEA